MPASVRRVGVLERLHCLKTFPLFSALPPDELTALAEAAREVFFAKRAPIIAGGEPIRDVHFVVEGRVRVDAPDGGTKTLGAGAGVGLLELLARTDRGPAAVAETETLTLALDRESLLVALEDEFGIWKHLLAAMSVPLIAEASRGGLDVPEAPDDPPGPESLRGLGRELDFAELILFLRRALPFAERNIVMLAELSRWAREVRSAEGETIWKVDDRAESFRVVLAGEIVCKAPGGRPFRAGHHHPAGLLEALTGGPRWYAATASAPTRAFEIPGRALLDAFEDNSELAMAFMGSLAQALLGSDAWRHAGAGPSFASVSASG